MFLSSILASTGNYFGLLFGLIIVSACLLWIMFGVNFISESCSEINEIKRYLKNHKELYEKGYFTKEEYEQRCKELKKELWNV